MNSWGRLDKKAKVGIFLVITVFIILIIYFGSKNEKELFIEVPKSVQASKNGNVILRGRTLPDTDVKIGLGILGDKEKSNSSGKFKLKYTLYGNSSDTLKITAENDSDKKVAKVTVKPSKNDNNSSISEKSSSSFVDSSSANSGVENSTAINKMASQYTTAYVVKFKDYDIIYLINENTNTIAYTTSDDHSISTSTYTGNFNDGIDFNMDGLAMHAHYKYVDAPSALIVSDASGNENKAYKNDPNTIIKYYRLYK